MVIHPEKKQGNFLLFNRDLLEQVGMGERYCYRVTIFLPTSLRLLKTKVRSYIARSPT